MDAIIQVKKISKTFEGTDGAVTALQDVSLTINRGEIYGIIGMSGAGKSTFVRCLNYLEQPTAGTVIIDGQDLSILRERELRRARADIAMIFQHFNLLMQKNVIDNICFPLELAGVKRKEARKRAEELLEVVGLKDKAKAYPIQLSGGQKQRVAIARALAGNPKILLCDEATSALDPQTTSAILELLAQINQKYGITIVIITHEMAVIQKVCSHVAILDHGHLAETGRVTDIFTTPKTKEARRLLSGEDHTIQHMEGKRVIRVVFDGNSSFEPVLANVILTVKEPLNVLHADTKNIQGIAYGEMLLQLPENEEKAQQFLQAFQRSKVNVEEVFDYVDNRDY